MKKILFSLVALVASMSMNAQVMKIMKNGEEVARYNGADYTVVFEEAQASTTTGTAKATIGGSEVDVNWVQLWENGPKFAEKNIGANSVTDQGNTMAFTDATKTGDEYAWGVNWCTPSKDQMNELLLAATSDGSDKVTCAYTQKNGVYGFEFTGKTTGYESNSVFFPVLFGDSDNGRANYWSGAANGSGAWDMYLSYKYGNWYSDWYSDDQGNAYLVRPVLKN